MSMILCSGTLKVNNFRMLVKDIYGTNYKENPMALK